MNTEVLCQPPNKQLQRTVIRHRGDAASAPFHYALASRWLAWRAAAELRRYTTHAVASFRLVEGAVVVAMTVRTAESDGDLEKISSVLLQLRTGFNQESLIAQIKKQRQLGYQVVYVESAGEVLCVAGFVVGTKLGWGKHIYVDDLVTAENQRSKGAGAKMVAWLKSHARQLGCTQLHLDSGVQRFAAHRFYLRERFNIAGHHFSITDLGEAKD